MIAIRPRSIGPRARQLMLAGLLLPVLAACNIDRNEIVGSIPEDYRVRHPIVLEDGQITMDVPIGVGQGGLPEGLRSNVTAFGKGFKDSGTMRMTMLVPTGAANQLAAATTAGQIRQTLQALGIPPGAIETRTYLAGPKEANAAIRLAYGRVVAKTDPCGRWPDQTANTSENRNYANFGCATQQNMAAMLDNPMDLMYPREMTPPDAERRGEVLKNYRSGTATQSDSSSDGSASIARNVGQ
jgi:pilus assembly protein CpaD